MPVGHDRANESAHGGLVGEDLSRKLRDLTARDVDAWLVELSASLRTATLQRVRSCLNRSVRRAMARDLGKPNVVELAEVPLGQAGRQSKSLTPEQVDGVLTETAPDRLHHYVLSLLTGARTEELRALSWEHVHVDQVGNVPPHVEVWRLVRLSGDTKTNESRRTLALPAELVYRHQLRPVIQTGATVMDELFRANRRQAD